MSVSLISEIEPSGCFTEGSMTLPAWQFAPPIIVDPPKRLPYPFGIFSVATVLDLTDSVEDRHAENGVMAQPYSCKPAKPWAPDCEGNSPKEPDFGVDTECASPFSLYSAHDCGPFGFTLEQGFERAKENLILGEQRGVEAAFWTGSLGNEPHLAGPNTVDLTPVSGALQINAGMLALEGYLVRHYGALGVIHAPGGVPTLLASENLLCQTCTGTRLVTHMGNAVYASGGSPNTGPDGTDAPDGEAWMYATGQIVIRRSPIFEVPNAEQLYQALNRSTNEILAFAERKYSVWTECVVAAVRVNISID